VVCTHKRYTKADNHELTTIVTVDVRLGRWGKD